MNCELRLLAAADLDFAHGLSRQAGWNQTRRDWERFLHLAPDGCFLAMHDGQPAGTVTTTAYGRDIAWIGMVLVHPDFRRRGIGTVLLQRAIDCLREEKGVACVRLDATPEGRPLYEGLGFRSEWGLRRWVREAAKIHHVAHAETAMPGLDAGFSLDREIFGTDRGELLRSLAAGSDEGMVLPDGSFGLMREGARAHYLGPISAASAESGLAIATELISRCPSGRPIYWDLPDDNAAATELAAKLGFQPIRALTRMWLGDTAIPQDPQRIFGLADPGLG
ncbi:MAG TPA: GNAT family N-acetyltransferase [Bacteroidia bacterium]|nr:GNAT family N-acetyltransferase [Bacteroidia bacterium]